MPRSLVKGGLPMATATAPRNEVYLSLLAGRAVTSLIDLAGDPTIWNDRVERACEMVSATVRRSGRAETRVSAIVPPKLGAP